MPSIGRSVGIIVALATLAGALCVDGGFVYDDRHAIVQSPVVQGQVGLLESVSARDFWGLPLGGAAKVSWRPALPLMWRGLWLAGGGSPLPFRLLGILLHVGASLAAFGLLRQLLPPRPALLAGALFALHPTHGEAIGGMVGHADIAASAAIFAALALVLRGSARDVSLAVLVAGVGALFKESALLGVVLGGVVLLAERADLRRWRAFALPAVVVSAAVLAMVTRAHGGAREGVLDNVLGVLAPSARVVTAFAIIARQALQLVLPIGVAPDHSYGVFSTDVGPIVAEAAVGAVLVLLAAGVGLLALRRGDRARALWIALAAGPIVAGSNLLFIGPTEYAERALYPATLAACAAIAPLLVERRIVAGVLLAAALLFSARTTVPWRSQRALFEAAVQTEPRSWRIHHNLGDALAREGEVERGLWHVMLATHLKRSAPAPVDWRVVDALTLAEGSERLLLAPGALAPNDACGLIEAFAVAAYGGSPDPGAIARTRALFRTRYPCGPGR
ncbi:MAG: hypothetical protein H6747_12735 [Deltaproteobacteria bacterium]|nr:hypothetical protein [Deltaproteobacteria bacterium]